MKDKPFFFIQISDPQFGMFAPDTDQYPETELLESAVAHINRLAPAFVVCTGDLIDRPKNETQLALAKQVLDQIDPAIPLHFVCGNHDIGDAPDRAAIDWCQHNISADYYCFDHHHFHFIALDSCIIVDPKNAVKHSKYQWTWLCEDLQRVSQYNPDTIVLMHHPLFLVSPDEPNDYFNIPIEPRQRLLDLFTEFSVRAVLSGHLHRTNRASHGNIKLITTGPVGMPLGPDPSGLRVIKVHDHTITHKYFALDQPITTDF